MNRGSPPPPPQESGLSAWIGGQLHPLESVPPALAVLLITVVIAFFTEFASNTATIIIFLPVLAELVRIRAGAGPGREARGRWDPAGEQARVRGPGAVAGLGGVGGARAPRVRNPPSGGEAGFVRLLVGGLLGATKRRVVGLLPPGVLSRVWAQPVLSKADSKGPRSEGG